ncbi:MAG TPA: SlyX family protein [Steroidobacteraceae bacterium]|nr:SlyX family protein [Steroidobacteraceae bacterium]
MEQALERIETRIAYLERANAELSDVVYRQHQEIDGLRMRLALLLDRVESMAAPSRSPEEERPPHY